ncbi:IS630 family transposase [Streptomyces lydicus]|uniref:IS630 family transposase n=1 Tax=Streptomyces lydicus TaxID=47763 RepID=UPI003789944B
MLTASERHRLKKMAYGHKTPYQARQRATIVLLAARGRPNARIAVQTRLHVDTVRTWRGRFAAGGLPAPADRKRSGRPVSFTALQVAEVKALACQLPAETGTPLSRWSCPDLAREVVAQSIAGAISSSTVRRWLKQDALKPWQYRSWIFVRDPAFGRKAARVLDLYSRTFDGVPLGEDEYVISADEKTSIQARCRCHPTLAPGQARATRVNHEYDRGGAVAYLAAYDVHRARVFGRCEPKTGIRPFMNLVTQVMTTEPYASARRVFWIVDNGSSHRGKKAIDRLTRAFPNAVMVHTPVHASWTNQIEIFFSIVQRKVVSPNDFTDLSEVRDRLEHSKTATTPRHSHSSGGSPPPTWTICWPGSADTHSIGRKNPPPVSSHDQPPKDFERRPLSQATSCDHVFVFPDGGPMGGSVIEAPTQYNRGYVMGSRWNLLLARCQCQISKRKPLARIQPGGGGGQEQTVSRCPAPRRWDPHAGPGVPHLPPQQIMDGLVSPVITPLAEVRAAREKSALRLLKPVATWLADTSPQCLEFHEVRQYTCRPIPPTTPCVQDAVRRHTEPTPGGCPAPRPCGVRRTRPLVPLS